MCSAPKMPKMEPLEQQPLPKLDPLPEVEAPPVATPQETKMPQIQQSQMLAPSAGRNQVMPTPAPPAPIIQPQQQPVPPPQIVDPNSEENAIVKRRKSKRQELQQASSGTDALRIKLDKSKSIGSSAAGGTGSTGLNIPK